MAVSSLAPQQRQEQVRLFSTDNERWQAVVERDPAANGVFFYAVKTTGVYCRPVCSARLPLEKNVRFYASCAAAEVAGFRPCRRCRPTEQSRAARSADVVARACRLIEVADDVPSLDSLAEAVGLSPHHFHRLFKAQTGLTPKAYATAQRAARVRQVLKQTDSVTEAIYSAGFQSSGRFYSGTAAMLGMTPSAFRSGGKGTTIRFAVGECWLGSFLVAATEIGVCAILLGDEPEALLHDLEDRFPNSHLVGGDADFEQHVAQVVALLESPQAAHPLPLDIRGTAFQRQVWQALRDIPAGQTASYSEIAQHIGRPRAIRAVGQACARNPLAVAIPCHRAVRKSGDLSGYRWGLERKSQLLEREQS